MRKSMWAALAIMALMALSGLAGVRAAEQRYGVDALSADQRMMCNQVLSDALMGEGISVPGGATALLSYPLPDLDKSQWAAVDENYKAIKARGGGKTWVAKMANQCVMVADTTLSKARIDDHLDQAATCVYVGGHLLEGDTSGALAHFARLEFDMRLGVRLAGADPFALDIYFSSFQQQAAAVRVPQAEVPAYKACADFSSPQQDLGAFAYRQLPRNMASSAKTFMSLWKVWRQSADLRTTTVCAAGNFNDDIFGNMGDYYYVEGKLQAQLPSVSAKVADDFVNKLWAYVGYSMKTIPSAQIASRCQYYQQH